MAPPTANFLVPPSQRRRRSLELRRSTSSRVQQATALGLLWLSLLGCGSTRTLQVPIEVAAAVPVQQDQSLWIASGAGEGSVAVADLLAGYLTGRAARVERVALRTLEPARLQGQIPPGTVVVLVEAQLLDTSRTRFFQRPQTFCGPGGCYTQYRSFPMEVPGVRGELSITAYDGPSAEVLHRSELNASRSGESPLVLRRLVSVALAERALPLFQARASVAEIELLGDVGPDAAAALNALEQGNIEAGHRQLLAIVEAPTFQQRARAQQTRIQFNLAQSYRLRALKLDDHDAAQRSIEQARSILQAVQADAGGDFSPQLTQATVDLAAQERELQRRLRAAEDPSPPPAGLPEVPDSYRSPAP